MSDFKSKLPDLKEISSIATKLFKDVKTSVGEIIDDYKQKREAQAQAEEKESAVKETKAAAQPATPKKETPASEEKTEEVKTGKANTSDKSAEEPKQDN
ncbi:hypothetical protein [Legionella spiritensis]|uniref:Uncharacterized protein n=1 Tax=Legionella spiritensis TaxID=452 RepID=A0A0W0Z8X0_LEGSP|nr:hypothetical protein [Legionella spiritensis]KTD65497.1 hypothetical protein Lspi_0571 [Legionella spiritensis]SNV35938.1 Uncharacterised protein [Legionella spiritensis]